LQVWIQAAFFGLTIIEVPGYSQKNFGKELVLSDDPYGYYITLMETEHLLYQKKTIN